MIKQQGAVIRLGPEEAPESPTLDNSLEGNKIGRIAQR